MRSFMTLLLPLAATSLASDIVYPQAFHWNGTRGLTQTRSGEALGEGTLAISTHGSYHKVERPGALLDGADFHAGTIAVGLGVSDWADLSGWSSLYNVPADKGVSPNVGWGSSGGQVQLTAPWDTAFPFRLAIQGGLVTGTSGGAPEVAVRPDGQILADGWNYFETRSGYDFQVRLIQTFRWGSVSFPVRIHLNEGMNHSIQSGTEDLALLDAALELDPHPILSIGFEGHARTRLSAIDLAERTWATGSLTFHLPASVQLTAGVDVRASPERKDAPVAIPGQPKPVAYTNTLDTWQAFYGLSIPFDLAASARRDRADIRRNDSLERLALRGKVVECEAQGVKLGQRIDSLKGAVREAQLARDSLMYKSKLDSIAVDNCRHNAKSQVARMNDSLARRSSQDSMALADARRQIEEERLKRGDLEASFLKTGMMNLDAVYFELGKATITPNSRPYLNLIGAILVKYPKLRFEVGGHTDNQGKPGTNLKLSQARAQAVKKYLASIHPELTSTVSAKGYGDTKPKATNKSAVGREMNRRVEIVVTNLEALKEYSKP